MGYLRRGNPRHAHARARTHTHPYMHTHKCEHIKNLYISLIAYSESLFFERRSSIHQPGHCTIPPALRESSLTHSWLILARRWPSLTWADESQLNSQGRTQMLGNGADPVPLVTMTSRSLGSFPGYLTPILSIKLKLT